jgi:hypothetical protein
MRGIPFAFVTIGTLTLGVCAAWAGDFSSSRAYPLEAPNAPEKPDGRSQLKRRGKA